MKTELKSLWLVIAGLLMMYIPTIHTLMTVVWEREGQEHGPLILAVVLYLIWEKRGLFNQIDASYKARVSHYVLLVIGLLLYIVGRSQDILIFEVGSQIVVLMALILLIYGKSVLKALWFPIFFIVFELPLPGVLIDTVTGPLKQHISGIAEAFLYQLDYPIARSGVTLTIGQYQLLVADACSGLHSMFSLSALGLLYLYLMQHKSRIRNVILVSSLLPMAFIANVARVIILVLVTYHFGDEAGQGFIHGFAGIVLFVVSLLFLFTLDQMLGKLKVMQG